VPLIREIVAEILAGGSVAATPAPNIVALSQPVPEQPVGRFDAFADAPEATATPVDDEPEDEPEPEPVPAPEKASAAKVGNPGHGDDLWSQVRAYWDECRSIKQTAEKFGLSPNSVKTRARREGWNK
jgi:hypothetical protein